MIGSKNEYERRLRRGVDVDGNEGDAEEGVGELQQVVRVCVGGTEAELEGASKDMEGDDPTR